MGKKKKSMFRDRDNSIKDFIPFFVLLPFFFYFFTPNFRWGFNDWAWILFLGGIISFIRSIKRTKRPQLAPWITMMTALFLLIVLPLLTSAAMFHAQTYASLLGGVEDGSFLDDMEAVDPSQIRLVDREMAGVLGEKTIGQDPSLGSSAKLGDFSIQQVKGELYWVAPLIHRSFSKWWVNRQGTPGYITVSATNPQDVKLVQKTSKGPVRIKYQPWGYLGTRIRRYLYFHGHMAVGLTDYTFEIDDEGNPFWVISRYRKSVGFRGDNIIGITLLDAATGEIRKFPVEEAPDWIDRIQPEHIVNKQLNDWGKYRNGWLNAVISETGVLKSTPGMSLVYGGDGRSYWYTGLTSSGSDESTVGFVLIDTRNKSTKYYKQSGATEYAAAQSAEGKVQEKGYRASQPILYNVLGKPTYVCTLKDKAGLIKMIAYISVEDYSLVGIGEDRQDALRSYRSVLSGSLVGQNLEKELKLENIKGRISRISSSVENGESLYYFMIQGDKRIFVGSADSGTAIVLTAAADLVELQFEAEGPSENQQDITFFRNLSMEGQ